MLDLLGCLPACGQHPRRLWGVRRCPAAGRYDPLYLDDEGTAQLAKLDRRYMVGFALAPTPVRDAWWLCNVGDRAHRGAVA